MKFQIVFAAICAFVAVSSKKGFFQPNGLQAVNLNNRANSCGNALAINSGFWGDANACSNSAATNYNVVGQQQGGNCY